MHGILRGLTGVQLLILDDWGLEPLDAGARRDLYEILEERYGRRSTRADDFTLSPAGSSAPSLIG